MTNLKFTKTHEWIDPSNDSMSVGITEHAQELLGDIVFVELPEEGKTVQAGDELGVIESVKAASDFYAPVSGVISEVNHEVTANPALINTDPLDAGWLVRIKPSNTSDINELLSADEYASQISESH